MKVKTTMITYFKILFLTMILFLCNMVGSMIAGLGSTQQINNPISAAFALLGVSLLSVIAISYPIIRSKWSGFRLIFTVFILFFGIRTFLTQIETVVFLKYLVDIVPAEMIPKLFVQGLIVAALFSPVAVLILGRFRATKHEETSDRLIISTKNWIWKLLLIGMIYVVIYITFGMFVFKPLAGKVFDEFYANLKMPSWILPFQIVRGIIWALLALPVIRMMRGKLWEAGLAVALLFSILMGSLLLVPTDIMPDVIRISHFIEVTSSNFLFGWIVVYLLNWQPKRNP